MKALLLTLALALVACGDGDGEKGPLSAPSTTTTPTTAAQPPSTPEVSSPATTVAPASCSAGDRTVITGKTRSHASVEGEGTTVMARISACQGNEADAALTIDNLPDDSVQSERHELHFRRAGSDWQVTSDRHTQRCRPGRGHTDFSTRPCV